MVTVHQESGQQVSNGFQFSVTGTPISTTIQHNGLRMIELGGNVKLLNKHATQDGKLNFSYDISVAYQ